MKLTRKVKTNFEKTKAMIAGGWGKHGPYLYSGIKRGVFSIGASIGTRGKEIYTSVNKNKSQFRLKHNLNTGIFKPRLKVYK
ncbi:hypothetical protein H6501_04210 [Candidatus Woesearchaeota archaeon]|nr:hypothetical protein [Candidatus Woesearchaeota archaeon]USN43877.1 MAG: hypothetical protein H6500_05810 [Candidatus Woesearchaeota archaeon]